MPDALFNDAIQILNQYWSYPSFRSQQEPVVKRILSGKNTIAVLPTGGGKSICYQVPGLVFEGLCLVISPLIALMQDQVSQLNKRGIEAKALYSGLSFKEQDKLLDQAINLDFKFLYISPERIKTRLFEARFKQMNIALIAIDEAHCISQWGHDFRPSYRNIAKLREWKPQAPIMAVTATATKEVQQDIIESLQFKDDYVITFPSRRENLSFKVWKTESKRQILHNIVQQNNGSTGIIYVRSRMMCTKLAQFLKDVNINAEPYHAGLKPEIKEKLLQDWTNDVIPVIVATNAFGMGIDKNNVRFVVHYDMPPTLEEYIQEAGRAGRDGKEASANLLFYPGDYQKKLKSIERSFPERDKIRKVYKNLANYAQIATGSLMEQTMYFDIDQFSEKYKMSKSVVYHSMNLLHLAGYIFLNEGYFKTAKFWFYTDKVKGFIHSKRSEEANDLIRQMFRNYEGIQYKMVNINEYELSKQLRWKTAKVKKFLTGFNKVEIGEYQQASDKPMFQFIGYREESKSLLLTPSILEDRKQHRIEKLEAVHEYINTKDCRQTFIDKYFGFETDTSCQVCDLCKEQMGTSSIGTISDRIMSLLKSESTTLNDVLSHFEKQDKKRVLDSIQQLVDDELITFDHNVMTLT